MSDDDYSSDDSGRFLKKGKLGGLGSKKQVIGSLDNAHSLGHLQGSKFDSPSPTGMQDASPKD